MANRFGTVANETLGTSSSGTLLATAGNDIIDGGGGNDILVYELSSPLAGGTDAYRGGTGWDTLELRFTAAEWSTPGLQAKVLAFYNTLASVPRDPLTGNVLASTNFATLDFGGGKVLNLASLENLRVLVDNVEQRLDFTPVILAATASGTVREDLTFITSGNINFLDLNLADTHTVSVAPVDVNQPSYGNLSANITNFATGDGAGVVRWNYALNNTAAQALAQGQSVVLNFILTISEIGSPTNFVQQAIAITVTGRNDGPAVITADLIGFVTEGSGNLQEAGFITFRDVDLIDTHSVISVVPGPGPAPVGSLTTIITQTAQGGLVGNLSWAYTVQESAINYLAAGETKVDTFVVGVQDSSGGTVTRTVTITITGTNDAPTIVSAVDAGDVTEVIDGGVGENTSVLSDTGTIVFADVDVTDQHSVLVVDGASSGYLGTFTPVLTQATKTVNWTFSVNDSALDFLRAGQQLTQTYAVSIKDDSGISNDTVTQTVTITITGTNDAPTIVSAVDTGDVTEVIDGAVGENASVLSDVGTIVFADVDVTDQHSFQVVNGASGYLGTFTPVLTQATKTVNWTFSVNDSALDFLRAGQQLTQTYAVSIKDDSGISNDTVTQTVTITITGTNDAPTIVSAVDTGDVTEVIDGAVGENSSVLSDTGTIVFADVDVTDQHSLQVLDGASGYLGTFAPVLTQATKTVNWTFSVNDSALDFLRAGQQLTQTYAVSIKDDSGISNDTVTQAVTITITGTNDAPTISSAVDTGDVTEVIDGAVGENASVLSDTGTIVFADVDVTDQHSLQVVNGASGYLGTFTPALTQATKTVIWTFSVNDSAVDFLAADEHLTQTYAVSIVDNSGSLNNSVTQTVTITIQGTNDAPTVVSATTVASGAVTEDAGSTPLTTDSITATGSIAFDDVDLTDAHTATYAFVANPLTPTQTALGTLVLGDAVESAITTGGTFAWTYTLNNGLANHLKDGEVVTETYTVTVKDEALAPVSQNVVITITGTNDAPTLAVEATDVNTAILPESNAAMSATGRLTANDVDTGETDGLEALIVGAPVLVVTPALPPSLPGDPPSVKESAITALRGALAVFLNIDDADASGAVNWSFAVPAKGASAGADAGLFDFLLPGETATITYNVQVSDGTAVSQQQAITITVTGTDDAPELRFATSSGFSLEGAGSVTEDVLAVAVQPVTPPSLQVSGLYSLVDPDTPLASLVKSAGQPTAVLTGVADEGFDPMSLVPSPPYGLSLDSDSWTFTMPNDGAVQRLGNGSVVLTYAITLSDGPNTTAPQLLKITINGANDDATIGGTLTGTIAEAGGLQNAVQPGGSDTVTGMATSIDPDGPDGLFLEVVNGNSTYGTVNVGVNGLWSYKVNNSLQAVEALQAGVGQPTLTDTFTVTAADGTTETVMVTITGTNDNPVVSTAVGEDAGSVVESGDLSAIAEAGLGGQLEPTLALNTAAETALSGGLPGTQGEMQTLISNLMSTQGIDKPTAIAVFWDNFDDKYNDYGYVPINTAFVLLGVEYASYVKAGGSPFLDVTAKYTADSADSGTAPDRLQSMHDNLLGNLSNASLTDRGLTSLTGLIEAVDAALLTRAVYSGNETDGGLAAARAWDMANGFAPTASGTLSSTDVDASSTATWTGDAPGTYGTFAITAGGAWTYTLNNASPATQALHQGQVVTENFTATVTDNKGATATDTVTITITGTNDAPVVSTAPGQNLGAVVEEGNLDDGTPVTGTPTTGGMLSSTDVDTGATATWSGNTTGTYGTFAITAGGAWTYTLNNGAPTDNLAEGATATDRFVATVTDDFGGKAQQTVTVTITGTNDSPVVSTVAGQDAGSVVESGDLSAIAEAGLGGQLEPTLALNTAAETALGGVLPSTQGEMQTLISNLMSTQGIDKPTAIAVFWDNFDDKYNVYGYVPINTAFVLLGVEYASYVKAGGSPFLDVTAKYTADSADSGTAPDRLQSMHDNLLGNLSNASLIDRGLTSLTGLIAAVDAALLTRAVYSGNETDGGLAAARAWDMANGFAPTASGTLSSTDVDASSTATWTGDASGTYGTFAITAGGAWTYTLNNASPATQALHQGQVVTEMFTATVTDNKGATATDTVTITITGKNDAAVLSADVVALSEGNTPAAISTSGRLTISDVDNAATFVEQTNAPGTYGTFSVGTDGAWTYAASSAHDGFVAGTVYTDTFTVQALDGTTTTVKVNITGTNDDPVLTGPLDPQATLAAGTEDVTYTVSKADLLQGFSDVDDLTLNVTGLTASHGGTVSVTATGFAIASPANYRGPVTLTYNVVDEHGGSVGATQSFVLNSVPDADTVEGNRTLSEAVQKPDTNDLLVGTGNSAAQFSVATDAADAPGLEIGLKAKERFTGVVQLDSGGSYTVRSGDQTQSPQNFSASAFDDAWARWGIDLSIGTATTIPSGTATLASYDYKIEIINNVTSATLQSVDLEGDDVAALPSTGPGAVVFSGGTVFQNTLNIAQFLPGFDTKATGDYQIRVTAYENETTTAVLSNSINVKVVNNAPEAGDNTLNTNEDTAITIAAASLLGNDSDVDGQALSVVGVQDAFGGTVNLSSGSITFTPNANFNGSASFTYTISDGQNPPKTSTATVQVIVAAVNDAATIAASSAEDTAVVEAGGVANATNANQTAGGTLTVTDVDAGEAKFQTPSSLAGTYGNFTFDANTGVWGYSLNNDASNVQQLNLGDTQADTLTVTSFDGTASQNIAVTITGANDAAVLSADEVELSEGNTPAAISTSGRLTISDVDNAATFVEQTNAPGTYGTFSVGTDGAWTYAASSAHDGFVAGTVYTDTFTVQALDGTTTTVKVNITGTNDDPVLTGPLDPQATLAAGTEDVTYTVSKADLLQGFSDVDDLTLNVTDLTASHGGTVSVTATGFEIASPANYRGPVTLTYNVVDEHGGSVGATQSFVLNSVPDADTVEGNRTLSEAVQKPDTNDLLVGTGNSAAQFSVATDAADAPGLEIGLKAKERFTGVVQLDVADTSDRTYIVRSGDQLQSPQNYSLAGFDDAWARWGIDLSIGTATTVGATATLASYDYKIEVINNDTLVTLYSVDLDGDVVAAFPSSGPAPVVFNSGTVFQNTLNIAQFLPGFDTKATGDYQIRVTAYENEAPTAAVLSNSINVRVENNAPVAGPNTLNTNEDTAITIAAASLLGNDSDADGQALSVVSVQDATGGTVNLNLSSGSITFTPNANFNGTASFDYTISDGQNPPKTSTATVTVDVAPVNDAPTAANLSVQVGEDAQLTSQPLPGQDVDGNALTYTLVGPAPTGLTFNTNGTFSFDADATGAFDALNLGISAPVTFDYKVNDGAVDSDVATVTITVNGVNDLASITGTASGVVAESGGANPGLQSVIADLHSDDIDNPDDVFQEVSSAQPTAYGSFTLSASGVWNYMLDNDNPFVQALTPLPGSQLTDTFQVKSIDGTTRDVNITIFGNNDAPVVVGAATVDAATGDITFTASDVDGGAALSLIVDGTAVNLGSVNNDTSTTLALPAQVAAPGYSGQLVVTDGALTTNLDIFLAVGSSANNIIIAPAGALRAVMVGHGGADTLTGGSASDYLYGLANGDILSGGAGDDWLDGGAAGDTLQGGAGHDTLTGGDGNDTFVFTIDEIGALHADTIIGFSSGADSIQLSGSGFDALFVAPLAERLVVGVGPDQAHAQLYYTGGMLYYDADGTGGGEALLVAELVGAPTLSPGDFGP